MLKKTRKYQAISACKRGFTLVETLVALGIFSIAAVGLVSCLFSGIKLWRAVSRENSGYNLVFLELDELCRNLRQNVSLPTGNFTASATSLEFAAADSGQIRQLSYLFDPDSKSFSRSSKALSGGQARQSKKIFSADDAVFSYLVWDAQAKAYSWRERVAHSDKVPAAVSLQFVFSGRTWNKTVFLPAKR